MSFIDVFCAPLPRYFRTSYSLIFKTIRVTCPRNTVGDFRQVCEAFWNTERLEDVSENAFTIPEINTYIQK